MQVLQPEALVRHLPRRACPPSPSARMPGGGADSRPAFSLPATVQSALRARPETNRRSSGDRPSTNHELRLRVGPPFLLRLPTQRASPSSSRQSPQATAGFPSLSPSIHQSECPLLTRGQPIRSAIHPAFAFVRGGTFQSLPRKRCVRLVGATRCGLKEAAAGRGRLRRPGTLR